MRYLRRALEIKEGLFGADSPETAKDLNDLGHAFLRRATHALAEQYLERARRLWNPVTDAPNLAATLDNLGQVHMVMGRANLAEPLFRDALEIRERELGEYAYGTSVTVVNLAQVAQEHGDLTGAVRLFKRAVDIRESIGDESNPSTAAAAHMLLASALEELGQLAEAVPQYNRAVELYRTSLGPRHPRTLYAAFQAAAHALELGDPSGDTALLEVIRALDDDAAEAAGSPSGSPTDLNNLGFAFWLRGDYATARRLYQLAQAQGPMPETLNNLGMIEERLGEYGEAVKHYRQALAILRGQGTPERQSSLYARILNNLGVSLTLGGDPASGGSCLEEALAVRRELQDDRGPGYAVTLRNLGLVAQRQGRLDDALRLMDEGRALLVRNPGVRSPEYARTLQSLGEVLADLGDDDAALTALQSALEIRRIAPGRGHPDTAVTFRSLANVLRRKGREAEACEALRAALPVFERYMGPDHSWTIHLRAESSPCLPDSTTPT